MHKTIKEYLFQSTLAIVVLFVSGCRVLSLQPTYQDSQIWSSIDDARFHEFYIEKDGKISEDERDSLAIDLEKRLAVLHSHDSSVDVMNATAFMVKENLYIDISSTRGSILDTRPSKDLDLPAHSLFLAEVDEAVPYDQPQRIILYPFAGDEEMFSKETLNRFPILDTFHKSSVQDKSLTYISSAEWTELLMEVGMNDTFKEFVFKRASPGFHVLHAGSSN